MADLASGTNNLLRHDSLIVVNELRSALSSWPDRLTALAALLIAFAALYFSLSERPFIVAAAAVATLAAVAGAGTSHLVQSRLDFHAYDGAIAANALCEGNRRSYALSVHAIVGGIVAICALISGPATTVFVLIGYLVGAASQHIARRALVRVGVARRPAPLRSIRALLQRPIAGVLVTIPVILPLLLLGSIEPAPMAAFIGTISALAALSLTMLDHGSVRFMTLSGYGSGRIFGIHARALSAFLLLVLPASLALSHSLVAIVVGSIGLAAMLLMAARILAYRVHSKRTADTIVSIGAAVMCLAGVATPLLLPLVAIAVLWHLYGRSVPVTWLLT